MGWDEMGMRMGMMTGMGMAMAMEIGLRMEMKLHQEPNTKACQRHQSARVQCSRYSQNAAAYRTQENINK